MKRVAVIAHRGKTLGGGLAELRRVLAERGVTDSFWREVPKSKLGARSRSRRRSTQGADLVFVWGGDGMVQRCIDVLAGIAGDARDPPRRHGQPARHNLGIPKDIEAAVDIGLHGATRAASTSGRINGERFAVMAGAGFDARMIGDADGGLKDRFGRLAYVWTGAKNLREKPFRAQDRGRRRKWFDGKASCILVGNVGKLFGGVEAFEDAQPDDGVLELGVVTADGVAEWTRTDRARRRRTAQPRRTRRRRRRARSASSSTARCRTSSTAATARR